MMCNDAGYSPMVMEDIVREAYIELTCHREHDGKAVWVKRDKKTAKSYLYVFNSKVLMYYCGALYYFAETYNDDTAQIIELLLELARSANIRINKVMIKNGDPEVVCII